MRLIPSELYSKDIIFYIECLLDFEHAKDFDSLDSIHKDKLSSLAMKALGGDVEIIMSEQANRYLADYLTSYDRDDQIELMNEVKKSTYEHFADYFNEMIHEEIENRLAYKRRSA